jgi:hypothetical protein
VSQFTSTIGRLSYYFEIGLESRPKIWRSQLAALARVLSRASGTDVDIETIKTIVMFCSVGLVVSLLLLRLAPNAGGLDMMDWI